MLGSDEGSGSVLTLAVAATLVVLAVALGLLSQATVVRAKAQAVADLSAIAAAQAAQRAVFVGTGAEPCDRAAEVAKRNGGAITACDEGTAAVVAVTVEVHAGVGAVRAAARAGPRW